MDRGTYVAASGGLLEAKRLDIIANNMANVNTVGYKAERLISRQQEFADTLAGLLQPTPARGPSDQLQTPGVIAVETVTDFTPGPVNNTGNPLNVALSQANQFFVVNTPNGEQYTRAGNFTLDSTGNLVTQDGQAVLGEGGPIVITGSSPSISSNGSINVDGQSLGRLRVVQIDDAAKLTRQEGVRFKLEGGQPTVVPANLVVQSVEMPNVNIVEAMVNMIDTQRSFESYQKTIQTINELNERALRSAASGGGG